MLTQRYYSLFSCRMRPTVSTNATVLVRQCAGHRFTVSLFDNGKEVETRNVTLVQRDGYLHSQRKWRFYPLIVVNGFQNEVYAVAPDQVDNLHVFKRFYGAGGFFFLLAGTLTVEHECFHRVREPTREPKEMESQ